MNNNKISIGFIKHYPDAVIPTLNETNVAYDLTAIRFVKEIGKHSIALDTGLVISFDEGYYLEIIPNNSIYKSGWVIQNKIISRLDANENTLKIVLTRIDNNNSPKPKLPLTLCQFVIRKAIYGNLHEIRIPNGIFFEKTDKEISFEKMKEIIYTGC
jgi:dUTPase